MTNPASPFATDRFALVIDGLCRAVAARIFARVMTGALIALIWSRLRRIDGLVQALATRFRAGTLRARVGSPRAAMVRGPATRPCLSVPNEFGWLLKLVPYEAAGFASQLRIVLAEPEMVALLAASPQVGRILRPLCRMLGVAASVLTQASSAWGNVACGDTAGVTGAPDTVEPGFAVAVVSALATGYVSVYQMRREGDPDAAIDFPAWGLP